MKLGFADAVEMGMGKHMVASLYRLRNTALSISLLSNSFSCMDVSSLGCLINKELTFYSVLRSEETMAAFSYSVTSNDLSGKPLPNCPMRV